MVAVRDRSSEAVPWLGLYHAAKCLKTGKGFTRSDYKTTYFLSNTENVRFIYHKYEIIHNNYHQINFLKRKRGSKLIFLKLSCHSQYNELTYAKNVTL